MVNTGLANTERKSMDYPKTEQEWWDTVDSHWKDLKAILKYFLPNRNQDVFEKAKTSRSRFLANHFNDAWFAAPDKPWIHDIPSWGIFCDLCSEQHVLTRKGDTHEKTDESGSV